MAPASVVIIVSGPPGTGKTTLAARLAADLRLPVMTKDRIKETLFDTLGWSDRAWSRRLGGAAVVLLYVWAAAELAAGRSFILESNFHPEQATPRFRALQAQYGFAPFQIGCRTDGPVLVARFQARAQSGTRHPGHVEATPAPDLLPTLLRGYYDDLAIGGPVIHLDTTDFARLDYAALLATVRTHLAAHGVLLI